MPESDPVPSDRLTRRAWAMLFVLCGSIFLEGIDISMMGVALPSIRADLDMSTASLQWVVSAYVLGYGGFVLLGGRAADMLGRRRMFLVWMGVFALFSGLGGLASEGWMLIVARFVTGVSAGFLAPAGLSIITTTFAEGRARNQAVLVYAGTAAGGWSVGLVVGGLLSAVDWRWVFFAPVLMALAILVAAIRLVPDDGRPERRSHGFDLPGAVTLTTAMLLLVYAVVQAPESDIAATAATLAGSVAVLAAFAMIERHSASPIMRLGILRSGSLLRANLGAMALTGAFFGFQFVAVLYLQQLRGWSPVETGLALLIAAIDAVIAPTLTPRLVARFGTTRVILAGFALAVVAYALFLPLGPDWTYLAMLPTLLLLGISFALAYGPLTIAATNGIAEHEQGLAGGLVNTSFQFGGALGLAIVTAVNVAATADGSPEALLDGFRAALVVPVALAAIGAAVTALGLVQRAAASEPAISGAR
jgi:MFS family permease